MAKILSYVILSVVALIAILSIVFDFLPMTLQYVVLSIFVVLAISGWVAYIFKSRLQRKWRVGRGLRGLGKTVNNMCEQLQVIGINASILEQARLTKGIKGQPHAGVFDTIVGRIKLQGRNIDAINIAVNLDSGWYFLDFIVTPSNPYDRNRRHVYLDMKRKFKDELLTLFSIYSSRIVDIEWKGDPVQARELNSDYKLMNKLINTDLSPLCGYLQVVPEPKYGCVRIRTSYFLPTPDLFGILEGIARTIKST